MSQGFLKDFLDSSLFDSRTGVHCEKLGSHHNRHAWHRVIEYYSVTFMRGREADGWGAIGNVKANGFAIIKDVCAASACKAAKCWVLDFG